MGKYWILGILFLFGLNTGVAQDLTERLKLVMESYQKDYSIKITMTSYFQDKPQTQVFYSEKKDTLFYVKLNEMETWTSGKYSLILSLSDKVAYLQQVQTYMPVKSPLDTSLAVFEYGKLAKAEGQQEVWEAYYKKGSVYSKVELFLDMTNNRIQKMICYYANPGLGTPFVTLNYEYNPVFVRTVKHPNEFVMNNRLKPSFKEWNLSLINN